MQPIEASTIEIDDENFSTGFPIKAHVSVGLFDNAIQLACDDVPVIGDTDIHTLATSAKRQHEMLWAISGNRSDGNRAFEFVHRTSKRFDRVKALANTAGGHRWNHLRIGRDLMMDL